VVGHAVPLALTEFWVVTPSRCIRVTYAREQLMAAANAVLDDGTVTSQIKRIRAKFLAIDSRFDAIQTVYGMGYRWQSE
jgi:two-component system OmpR family response regulator